MLSLRSRESIKTGLAMVIALGIAFRMAFEEPSWVMFSVAMVSMDTAGQSLNKAGLRMMGTLVAGVVALALIAAFPQARWGMVLMLGVYVGFCTYMMTGGKRQYFWFVSAFVCMTIMVHGGVDSAPAFQIAVARVEETALGILVYSLVSLFLWPQNSREVLEAASRTVLDAQRRLYQAYRARLRGQGEQVDIRPLRLETLRRLSQLRQMLSAAEIDTFEVRELRSTWREYVRQAIRLRDTLSRLRITLPEVQSLDLAGLVPGLDDFLEELDRRFAGIQRMLAGEAVEEAPRAVAPAVVDSAREALSHFDRAALELLSIQLRRLDEVSRRLWACVAVIVGSGSLPPEPSPDEPRRSLPGFDLERFRSAATIVATLWIGYPIWIWLDPPGHASFWYMATLWVMIATLNGISLTSLLPGFAFGIAASAVAYVGVMPQLSGYSELGLMIFLLVAGGFYLLWEPRRRGGRAIFIAMIASLCSFENQQTFSFAVFANSTAMILLSLGLAFAVTYLPGPPRPEKVFLRLLERFFRQAEFLMSRQAADQPASPPLAQRWRSAIYRANLWELPQKLDVLVDQIDFRLLPGSSQEQARALVANLFDLALRIHELGEAREHLRPEPGIEQLVQELREWRVLAQEQFRAWAADPSAMLVPGAEMAHRLSDRLARIEAKVETARTATGAELPRVDYSAIYRYLGCFRGLSEATIAHAGRAAALDWEPWREARF